ncbi:MAG: hypothetical protein K0U93_24240 [Gammaproteobacteria bacterium]|nr:hypothetical protein [Gammaproteobacteria bacterium]
MNTLIAGGVILLLGGLGLWLLVRQARKRGAAEYAKKAEREAREAEQDMSAAVLRDRDTDDDIGDLKDGTF